MKELYGVHGSVPVVQKYLVVRESVKTFHVVTSGGTCSNLCRNRIRKIELGDGFYLRLEDALVECITRVNNTMSEYRDTIMELSGVLSEHKEELKKLGIIYDD